MPAVLLVDDNVDTVEMYAVGLACAGYRPLTASDAWGALDRLKHERPDVVVMDLHLVGDREGWDLIEEIRVEPSSRGIPVLLLTGNTDPSITSKAKRLGCAAVLIKPCLPDELAEAVKQVLPAVVTAESYGNTDSRTPT
jgi:CheY-like chemotaxis protein